MSIESPVLRDACDGIVSLTLNRPGQQNALCEAMLAELQAALDEVGRDSDARVVVLGGAGRNFCAGHDLKEMRAHREREYYQRLFEQCSRVMGTLVRLPQPVIAKVQGIATAAGCQLVAMCDLAVAAETARFATSGINVGLFCSTPAVPLSRNVSRKRAFEMLVTGDFIDASTARDFGLVNRVVPEAGLDAAVAALARKISERSPSVVASGKRMFYGQLGMPFEQAATYAAEVMAGDMMSHAAGEGIDAFIEKRRPVWES
ncbi:MAG: enoyl-CoA hydratase [Myxococcales bacterium]|nr:enoyl-CoA hydratase [Myxococcales bacterium]